MRKTFFVQFTRKYFQANKITFLILFCLFYSPFARAIPFSVKFITPIDRSRYYTFCDEFKQDVEEGLEKLNITGHVGCVYKNSTEESGDDQMAIAIIGDVPSSNKINFELLHVKGSVTESDVGTNTEYDVVMNLNGHEIARVVEFSTIKKKDDYIQPHVTPSDGSWTWGIPT
jgi:hypothetical protein